MLLPVMMTMQMMDRTCLPAGLVLSREFGLTVLATHIRTS